MAMSEIMVIGQGKLPWSNQMAMTRLSFVHYIMFKCKSGPKMVVLGMRTDGRMDGAMENNVGKASSQKFRTLKVQDTGDFYKKEVRPAIRLQGKWLLVAGLQPGKQVQVTNPQQGVLILKSLE